jgi:hypothetical protein
MKTRFFLIFSFFWYLMQAQYPADTLYTTVFDTTPQLPPLYGSVIDTTVPGAIEITRISRYVPEWDWYPHHEYAKIQPWNADASLYKFYSVAIYDAHTHQMLYEIQNAGSIYPTYWSNTDPDLLYGFMENGDIKTYRVSTQQVTTVDHIYYDEQTQTDYEYLKLGPGEGNMDKNDRYVAFVGKHGADLDVIVYDLQQYRILHRRTFPGAWGNGTANFPQYVDWVSVSLSGDYVVIMWNTHTTSASQPFNGHYGVEVYNRNMQFLRRIAEYGNHGDFAFAQDGGEVFVQFWGPTGTMNMYYLDRLERVVLQTHPDIGQNGHITGRNINRPGWIYASVDLPGRGVILAVKLDTTGTVEYFGHHYSSCDSYLTASMPVPSPDGTKVMFKSDFENPDPEVVFTFIAQSYGQVSVPGSLTEEIAVFPNAAFDFIKVDANDKIIKLSVCDVTGKILMQEFSTNTIDISGLPPGMYYLRITDGRDRTLIRKFLKRGG